MNRQLKLLAQARGENVNFLRFEPGGVVHVEWIPNDQVSNAPLGYDRGQRHPALLWIGLDQCGERRGDAQIISIAEPDPAGTVIYSEKTHLTISRRQGSGCNFNCDQLGYGSVFAKMPDPLPALSPAELARYSRHILLEPFGIPGQQKLKAARVLVIGAGGLGSPAALYLAAAGIGTLGLADFDAVELHNLQRQILHDDASIGQSKTESAQRRLESANPLIRVVTHNDGVTRGNATELFAGYDVILDGTDNFSARYLNNDAAYFARRPLVYGSVYKFEGQVAVFDAHGGGPCYRCLFPEAPEPGTVPSCGEAGVIGALCGVIGSLQALEVIKLITGVGEPLRGRLLTYNALTQQFATLALPNDPGCALCGEHPTIQDLSTSASAPACPVVPAFASMSSLYPLELSVHETKALQESAPDRTAIIDVREPFELDICRLPGAEHIPMRQIPEHLDTLPRDKHLLILCHSGMRSLRVTEFLRARGFEAVSNITGGIEAWAAEIDPSLPRY